MTERVRASLELGLWRAKDALCLLHLGTTVAGIVHLQTVIQLVQVFFHFSYLFSGYVFQPKAHLWEKTKPWSLGLPLLTTWQTGISFLLGRPHWLPYPVPLRDVP